MPFAQLAADGEIEALYLKDGNTRVALPLSDIRVLRFLQASDPELTTALLNASDNVHRMLLSSLISLLVRNHTLLGDNPQDPDRLIEHQTLENLINQVETDDNEALHSLEQSDRNTVRIIEDVIDILLRHRVITLEDLPAGARHVLEVRRALRIYLAEADESE